MKKSVQNVLNTTNKIGLMSLSLASLTSLVMAIPSTANAAEITFQVTWSGAKYGYDNVVASGLITFFSLPPNGTSISGGAIANGPNPVGLGSLNVPKISSSNISDPVYNANNNISTFVKSLNVTITDPDFGSQALTLADFSGIIWDANYGNLDFTKQLVGQNTKGKTWGSIYIPVNNNTNDIYSKSYLERGKLNGAYGGDFNIFDDPTCVPTGYQPFTLRTCRRGPGGGVPLTLESFQVYNPRPVPVPGAIIGIVAAGGLLVFSKKKKAINSNPNQ
jgi:hypothetical protein